MLAGSKVLAAIVLVAAFVVSNGWLPGTTPTEAKAVQVAAHNTTAYTLPLGKLQKAVALNRIGMTLDVSREIWTVIQLLLILWLGVAARIRDIAVRISGSRWVQGISFAFLVLMMVFVLNLPFGIYGHRTALQYGLSVQGWSSWLGDKAKAFVIEWLIVSLAASRLPT